MTDNTTPRPWELSEFDLDDATAIGVRNPAVGLNEDNYMAIIADCGVVVGRDPGFIQAERRANAALIVRAVNAHDDLVAALESAFFALGRAGANANRQHDGREAWEQARAALAKARGE